MSGLRSDKPLSKAYTLSQLKENLRDHLQQSGKLKHKESRLLVNVTHSSRW
jgi:hypothetical protein